MRACSAFPRVGEQWMNEGRVALQKHWDENVRRGRKSLSSRAFARLYRLSHSRLQRELKAGFTGVLLRDKVHGGWIYPEYSAILAQQRAEQANAAKGRRSVVTNLFAVRLVALLARGFSVATCLHTLRLKGWERLPSQRTVHCHLKDDVIVLPIGGRGGIPPRPPNDAPSLRCTFHLTYYERKAARLGATCGAVRVGVRRDPRNEARKHVPHRRRKILASATRRWYLKSTQWVSYCIVRPHTKGRNLKLRNFW